MERPPPPVTRNGHADRVHLTEREQEVLRPLANGMRQKENVLPLSISPKTLGTRSELGVHSRAELDARAYGPGPVVAKLGAVLVGDDLT